jgi:hypothetical protein
VYEESPSFRGKPLEKLARPDLMVFKALELSHHPGYERLIDVPQQRVQCRWGIPPVVLDPTPQEWIELLGNVLQRQLPKDDAGFGLPPFEDCGSGYHFALSRHHPATLKVATHPPKVSRARPVAVCEPTRTHMQALCHDHIPEISTYAAKIPSELATIDREITKRTSPGQ